eukprot:TRINITY_DN87506_c0_g1_i1.p1 TRINITY_DN87506_c0_g1~~TRINITY_DN87506_c0_g1_i1.p1  ORF type:complete len:792 (+),score=168.06 TRINITY_DN87506_c0_g1_i1:121-2496(+)
MRPVAVLCEEERLRRLAEAMCRDGQEGAEPARQRRAQSFSQGIAALEEKLAMGAARRSQAVQALEAGLDARRRAVVEDMAAADSRHVAGQSSAGAERSPPHVLAGKAQAEEREHAKPPVQDFSSQRIDVQERLSDALDQITVRSVVSFRALLKVPVAVEAVTVAVLRLSTTGERSGNGDAVAPLPKNWDDARKVLLKPGHFVNALRRYAYAAEQGNVCEADTHYAEEALSDVQAKGEMLAEVHETAGQLHEWLRAAVDYAALTRARPQDVASPARAARSQQKPAADPDAEQSIAAGEAPSRPSAPVTAPSEVAGRPAASSSKSGGYPTQQQERQRQPQPKSVASGPSSARSPSPKLLRRPCGSSSTACVGSTAQAAPAAATVRPGGVTKSSSGLNVSWAAPKPESSAGTSTPAAPSAPRLARASVTGISPRRRASASPPPVAAYALSPSKHASTSSSSRTLTGNSKTASLNTSASGTSNSCSSSARPTRHSVGGSAASPLPASKRQTAVAQVSRHDRPNGSPLATRSPSAHRVSRRHSTVVAAGSSSTAVARAVSSNGHAVAIAASDAGGIPVGQLVPSPEDYASMRMKLEQEKKEIKQMRALESTLKWNMDREERRQTAEERQEEARQIMEWRESQATAMKEYVEDQSREQRVQDLLESKEYQHFKREWKQAVRLEEIEHIKEQLEKDMDNAHWQVELQKAIAIDRQLALQEKLEAAEELRELKEKERVREKASQENERAHELALDFAFQANQISAEKEELLRNLQFMRQQQRQPTRSGGSGFWPGGRRP